MTNITFSIDDEIHEKMKNHPEIKWTEILRQSIIDYLEKIVETDVISIKDFRKRLDSTVLQKIEDLDKKEEILFYDKGKELEKDRLAHLQDLERSSNTLCGY